MENTVRSVAVSIFVSCGVCLLSVQGQSGDARCTLRTAFYRPDRPPVGAWQESARGLEDFFRRDYRAAGGLHLFVQNKGDRPVRVTRILLDDKEIEEWMRSRRVIWWRVLPEPIPAEGVSEVYLRFRYPETKPLSVSLELENGQMLKATVPPDSPSCRVETIAFEPSLRRVYLVAEQASERPVPIRAVFVDGKDVTAHCRILAPKFFQGFCPIIINFERPLEKGSFHTYELLTESRERVAATVRTLDGFVPLGIYTGGDWEEYACNGLNAVAHFTLLSKDSLDMSAILGIRQQLIVGENPPPKELAGHPAVFNWTLHDEPDCWDYSAPVEPVAERLGYYAPEMVRRLQQCLQADPKTPTGLTINLTFQPANYYVYGPLADIVNPDCYPLTIGWDLRKVRDAITICRNASAPRLVTYTYQANYEERKEDMKFRRPPYPEEVRIMILYGLGAGARGFFGYEYVTEGPYSESGTKFHGTNEYPDIWHAIGATYRQLALVSPLIAQSHPTEFATPSTKNIWVRTLLCRDDAVILVCVNERYQSLPNSFRTEAVADATVTMPHLPWLKLRWAYLVKEGFFEPLKAHVSSEGIKILLPHLHCGCLVLLTGDERLPQQLLKLHQQNETQLALALLRAYRLRQQRQAEQASLKRRIPADFRDYAIEGQRLGSYGITYDGFWNPFAQRYNGAEWGGGEEAAMVSWRISVPAERAGKEHYIYYMSGHYGGPALWTVRNPEGKVLLEWQESGDWPGKVRKSVVTFPKAGEYTIEVRRLKGNHGRVAIALFVIPKDELFRDDKSILD